MRNLTVLTEKVLSILEKDTSKWDEWTSKKELYPVSQADAMKQFVSRIEEQKIKNEKVLVAGDYDCDGIMSTTIMVSGLRAFGIDCGFYIPDRIQEGYGLSEQTVRLAHQKGYTMILTVDNGVKAFKALALAKQYSICVIVTDHHTIEQEPDCDCLVHPGVLDSPFHVLCGAGIAYECMRALGVDTRYHLELAAIASIADVMPVIRETRAIIQNGLEALNEDHEKHLFPLATDRVLNETSVGFQIVPKLNAVGRLSNLANVNNVVRYFLSEDMKDITAFQQQINHINERRKTMSEQMCKEANERLDLSRKVFLIKKDSFHEGIIGLVAGSLCASYQRPVIVMTSSNQGYKASMRSPNGFDCMDFLSVFKGFSEIGGHKNAAGFSVNYQDFEEFETYVNQRALTYQWVPESIETLRVDPKELTLEAIESLDVLRPFGQGFTCPPFELTDVNIKSIFDISNGKHRKFTLVNGLQCMNFNQTKKDQEKSVVSIEGFVGNPQINTYRGKKQVNFIIDTINYK